MTIRAFLAGITLLAVSGLSYAGFDEGLAAHKRGDFITALSEWQPLAEQGDADAQSNLGAMYDNGQGVVQDFKKSYALFSIAAAHMARTCISAWRLEFISTLSGVY